MIFPQCGKVLVVDDKIEEALPLMNIMAKKGVSCSYYSGAYDCFPDKPFSDVRLVFCDLRFSIASDAKSVASNIVGILNKLVSRDNGPYILIAWSSHLPDYLEAIKAQIKSTEIEPEFILELDKTEYFSSTVTPSPQDLLHQFIDDLDLEIGAKKRLLEKAGGESPRVTFTPNEDALSQIEEALLEKLKEARLLHLFVLWENAVSKSAIETVNSIYHQIPEIIPSDKRLNAMLFYLSHYQLEQQLDSSSEEEKFAAAMMTLNHLFSYFCEDTVRSLSIDDFNIERIVNSDELQNLSKAKFNSWSLTSTPVLRLAPGNVYFDSQNRFCYHGWINKNIKSEEGRKAFDEINTQLVTDERIKNVFIDVSAECDIAQRKQYVAKIVPGVIIPSDLFIELKSDKKLKDNNLPEYICVIEPIEYKDDDEIKEGAFAFNLNLLQPVSVSELENAKPIFSFSKSVVASIKQKASSCIAKAGIAIF